MGFRDLKRWQTAFNCQWLKKGRTLPLQSACKLFPAQGGSLRNHPPQLDGVGDGTVRDEMRSLPELFDFQQPG